MVAVTGIVYLLTNEAMPGLVKIGKTNADDPQVRMDQLYNTSVPVPFECVLAKKVDDQDAVEMALHKAFRPNRFNPKREFFKIDTEQAVAVLNVVAGEDVTPTVNESNNAIAEVERSSSERLRTRRPNLNFQGNGNSTRSCPRSDHGGRDGPVSLMTGRCASVIKKCH